MFMCSANLAFGCGKTLERVLTYSPPLHLTRTPTRTLTSLHTPPLCARFGPHLLHSLPRVHPSPLHRAYTSHSLRVCIHQYCVCDLHQTHLLCVCAYPLISCPRRFIAVSWKWSARNPRTCVCAVSVVLLCCLMCCIALCFCVVARARALLFFGCAVRTPHTLLLGFCSLPHSYYC